MHFFPQTTMREKLVTAISNCMSFHFDIPCFGEVLFIKAKIKTMFKSAVHLNVWNERHLKNTTPLERHASYCMRGTIWLPAQSLVDVAIHLTWKNHTHF